MKKKSCVEYNVTIFWDTTSNFRFITRSTTNKKETINVGSAKYALVRVDVSSASHGFYGEKHHSTDHTRSSEKFRQKYYSEK